MANLIASAALFIFLMMTNRPKRLNIDLQLWKKMALYGLPLVIVGIAGSINQFFAVPLQKYLLGEAIELNRDRAAVYGAVQKIPALLALFTTAYNYAAEPFFFKNAEEKDAKKLYGEILLFFVLAGGIACVALNSLISTFGFLIGPNFREGLYLVPILLLAYLFLGIYYNVSIWYKLSDRTIYGAYISLFGAAITLAGSLLLLPIYGVDASAWVALLCYVLMVLIAFKLGKSKYPIDYPVERVVLHIMIISSFLLIGSYLNAQAYSSFLIGLATVLLYVVMILSIEKRRVLALFRGN
jgi:O-antigen/teichoic acid export membrane protein